MLEIHRHISDWGPSGGYSFPFVNRNQFQAATPNLGESSSVGDWKHLKDAAESPTLNWKSKLLETESGRSETSSIQETHEQVFKPLTELRAEAG